MKVVTHPERPRPVWFAVYTAAILGGDRYARVDYRELSADDADLQSLRLFYDSLYAATFPDENERESYDNIVQYLRGAAGPDCDYRVVLVFDEGQIAGGAICDYFIPSNSAVIEFITLAERYRGIGLGTRLLQSTERWIQARALAHGRELDFVIAEINDPFRRTSAPDSMDPFTRALWWARRGYGRLEFPYVQPALSEHQSAVGNLLLTVKPTLDPNAKVLSAVKVDAFVRDYLVYAMRVPEPDASPQYATMAAWLRRECHVRIGPLDAYVGEDANDPLLCRETGLDDVLELYAGVRVDPNSIASTRPRPHGKRSAFVWDIRHANGNELAGLIAFATVPGSAAVRLFGATERALHSIVPWIERRMMTVSDDTVGWYLECSRDVAVENLRGCGFYEVDVDYEPGLRLLYKEFGARFEAPAVRPDDFLLAARALGIQDPRLEAQARSWQRVPIR